MDMQYYHKKKYDILEIRGNILNPDCKQLEKDIFAHWLASENKIIILHFFDAQFICRQAIGLLFKISLEFEKSQKMMRIVVASSSLINIFEMVGLADHVPVYRNFSDIPFE